MLKGFLQMHKKIKKTTIIANNDWEFINEEIYSLWDLLHALKPLEMAIKKLGSREMNLIGTECVLQWVMSEFCHLVSPVALELKENL